MDVLWRARAPLAVREVSGKLCRELAYTTVMTTLDRLYKKGLAAREKDGTAFRYWPALSRDDYHKRLVTEAVGGMLEKSSAPVLAAFVDVAAKVDAENLKRLAELVAARRRKR